MRHNKITKDEELHNDFKQKNISEASLSVGDLFIYGGIYDIPKDVGYISSITYDVIDSSLVFTIVWMYEYSNSQKDIKTVCKQEDCTHESYSSMSTWSFLRYMSVTEFDQRSDA